MSRRIVGVFPEARDVAALCRDFTWDLTRLPTRFPARGLTRVLTRLPTRDLTRIPIAGRPHRTAYVR
ncbi:hypothetical protein ABZV24_27795 [Streptomyces sp. NPDC005251]|uniref:hypothetical protein n=1 Tax=Streptomyces sp. NPDC005251 TaxID=3157166 RepID=UPI0033A8AAA8